MKFASIRGAPIHPAATLLLAVSCLALAGFGSVDKKKPSDAPIPLTVPKATCGPNDHPETGAHNRDQARQQDEEVEGQQDYRARDTARHRA